MLHCPSRNFPFHPPTPPCSNTASHFFITTCLKRYDRFDSDCGRHRLRPATVPHLENSIDFEM